MKRTPKTLSKRWLKKKAKADRKRHRRRWKRTRESDHQAYLSSLGPHHYVNDPIAY